MKPVLKKLIIDHYVELNTQICTGRNTTGPNTETPRPTLTGYEGFSDRYRRTRSKDESIKERCRTDAHRDCEHCMQVFSESRLAIPLTSSYARKALEQVRALPTPRTCKGGRGLWKSMIVSLATRNKA